MVLCDKRYNFLVCSLFLLESSADFKFLSSNFTSERTFSPEYLDSLSRVGVI